MRHAAPRSITSRPNTRAYERTANLNRRELLAIPGAQQYELRFHGEQRLEVALFEIRDFGRSPIWDNRLGRQDATSVKHLFTDAQFTVRI